MFLKSEKLELRGVSVKKSTKTGNLYKVANMETVSTGEPFEVYLGDGSKFDSLVNGKKGAHFCLTFDRDKYKNLDLIQVEQING